MGSTQRMHSLVADGQLSTPAHDQGSRTRAHCGSEARWGIQTCERNGCRSHSRFYASVNLSLHDVCSAFTPGWGIHFMPPTSDDSARKKLSTQYLSSSQQVKRTHDEASNNGVDHDPCLIFRHKLKREAQRRF